MSHSTVPPDVATASFLQRASPTLRAFIEARLTGSDSADANGPPNRKAARVAEALERSTPAPRRRLPSSRDRRRRVQELTERARERDRRYLDRLHRRLKERGVAIGAPPMLIPRRVWVATREILADESGRAGRIYLERERNRVAAGCIRVAAFVPGASGSRYTWADWRARAIVALGIALCMLGAVTRRRGIWQGLVRGVTRGALAALLANPWEPTRRPSISALAGTHRVGATFRTGQVGYLRALEQAGLFYRQQVAAAAAAPCERWGGDWASNRYWLVTSDPLLAGSDRLRQRLIELHRGGVAVAAEVFELAPARLNRLSAAASRARASS